MLVDPIFSPTPAPVAAVILQHSASHQSGPEGRIERGLYMNRHWSFDVLLPFGLDFDQRYPLITKGAPYLDCYGVCDSVEQFKTWAGNRLDVPDRFFCVSFVCIKREEQPSEGGWRYHKWGPYIGSQNPQHEYLYDDHHIDQVFTYHIYELTDGQFQPLVNPKEGV